MQIFSRPFSRAFKKAFLVLADSVMLTLALMLTFVLLEKDFFAAQQKSVLVLAVVIIVSMIFYTKLGLYRALVLYMGLQSSLLIVHCVTISALLLIGSYFIFQIPVGDEISILSLFWMMSLLFIGGSRFAGKLVLRGLIHNFRPKEPVIIYGAGSSGMQLVGSLQGGDQYLPVAFVDDGHEMLGSTVHGIRVYGPLSLSELTESYGVRKILLAIPSATHAERKEIINRLEHLPVHVKTVPDLFEMVSGKVGVDQVRDIDIEDLLGRDTVPPDPELLDACILDQSVLITGAAGSIGAELCRQIIAVRPSRLVILDAFEYGLYELENELSSMIKLLGEDVEIQLVACLGSVCNAAFLGSVINRYNVETIYHVAAYKQVPMVEKNIVEGARNNVFGTLVSAQAAERYGVKNFVFISTDKAVRPTNFMGATKRLSELVLQALAKDGARTRFSMVRFGNVLDSSGSVVPLFRQQINAGGPLTVTHPEVTRYFMTVQEAAQLVIQAGSMAQGGDVFVLDMSEPIRIVDLARKMVHLMGFAVRDEKDYNGDVPIEYIGLRAGEKLHEELLVSESVTGTEHPKIMRAQEEALDWSVLEPYLDRLEAACQRIDLDEIKDILLATIEGFEPESCVLGSPAAQEALSPALQGNSKVTPLFQKNDTTR
jgi:FlaA1/EpsC-like NDP-sugar epimerase